jgi:hypothetical protein
MLWVRVDLRIAGQVVCNNSIKLELLESFVGAERVECCRGAAHQDDGVVESEESIQVIHVEVLLSGSMSQVADG